MATPTKAKNKRKRSNKWQKTKKDSKKRKGKKAPEDRKSVPEECALATEIHRAIEQNLETQFDRLQDLAGNMVKSSAGTEKTERPVKVLKKALRKLAKRWSEGLPEPIAEKEQATETNTTEKSMKANKWDNKKGSNNSPGEEVEREPDQEVSHTKSKKTQTHSEDSTKGNKAPNMPSEKTKHHDQPSPEQDILSQSEDEEETGQNEELKSIPEEYFQTGPIQDCNPSVGEEGVKSSEGYEGDDSSPDAEMGQEPESREPALPENETTMSDEKDQDRESVKESSDRPTRTVT